WNKSVESYMCDWCNQMETGIVPIRGDESKQQHSHYIGFCTHDVKNEEAMGTFHFQDRVDNHNDNHHDDHDHDHHNQRMQKRDKLSRSDTQKVQIKPQKKVWRKPVLKRDRTKRLTKRQM